MSRFFAIFMLATSWAISASADDPKPRTAKEALHAFNDLIGAWRCTGRPVGSRDDQLQNFWVESLAFEWQFKGTDAWLKLDFGKGKYYTAGELRYDPATKRYKLQLQTSDKKNLAFEGDLTLRTSSSAPKLILERKQNDETQRLVFTLLHSNRFLYGYETRQAGKTLFQRRWNVGATKEGEAFATGDGKPECIVSGGTGTIAVAYQGKTYYVCCSGCRSEFLSDPQKYIAEYEAKKAKKNK